MLLLVIWLAISKKEHFWQNLSRIISWKRINRVILYIYLLTMTSDLVIYVVTKRSDLLHFTMLMCPTSSSQESHPGNSVINLQTQESNKIVNTSS